MSTHIKFGLYHVDSICCCTILYSTDKIGKCLFKHNDKNCSTYNHCANDYYQSTRLISCDSN